jgi:hypothetical protein
MCGAGLLHEFFHRLLFAYFGFARIKKSNQIVFRDAPAFFAGRVKFVEIKIVNRRKNNPLRRSQAEREPSSPSLFLQQVKITRFSSGSSEAC